MSMLAMKPIRRVARHVRSRVAPGGLILLYHRVNVLERDPQLLSVTPEHFAQHLEVMRRVGRVTTLSDLDAVSKSGRTPRRAIAITFDDGYADNLTYAKPLLERHDAPATVFVASDWIRTGESYFWDELSTLVLDAPTLPAEVRLTIDERDRVWTLGPTTSRATIDRAWNVLATKSKARQQLYCELCELIRPLSPVRRSAVIASLRSQIVDAPVTPRQSLTPTQIGELASDGLIEIGAHTAGHAMLSKLSEAEQLAQIEESRDALQIWTNGPIRSFSYPFGSRVDMTAQTVALVRSSGFDRACANWPGVVRSGADSFRLPRMLVRDWDGDAFERELRGWFHE